MNNTITVPLKDFCNLVIGDAHYAPVPPYIAEILIALFNKRESDIGFIVQTEAGPDEILTSPRLWHYRYWVITNAQWERARKWSEHNREIRFIEEANIKMVARECAKFFMTPEEIAHITASKLVRGNKQQQIQAIGVKRLYKTIEELP